MSEDDEFEAFVRFFEKGIARRPLTAEELAGLKDHWNSPQSKAERLASNPMAWARAKVEFMRRLKSRQGTKMPNFETLYQRKAELDEKLDQHEP